MANLSIDEFNKWELMGLTANKAEFLLWAWYGKQLPEVNYTYEDCIFILTTIEDDSKMLKLKGCFELIAKCRKIVLDSGQWSDGTFDKFLKTKEGKECFKQQSEGGLNGETEKS